MYTLDDYLNWRGDIDISYDGINEVDCALLSWLSYFEYQGLITGDGRKDTLNNIAERYLETHDIEADSKRDLFFNSVFKTFVKTAQTKRFGHVSLNCYQSVIDKDKGVQFSAMTFSVTPAQDILVYEGTDGTIVGWREDCALAYMDEVPAQRLAVEYMEKTISRRKKKTILCGHSKGGNLAAYALIKADEKKRYIEKVYNFDGPGMNDRIMASAEYKEALKKIETILPKTSIVGRLFGHSETFRVTDSDEKGFHQHDLTSWGIKGTSFDYLESVDNLSEYVDSTISAWISDISEERRKKFLDTLFLIFEKNNINTLEEFNALGSIKTLTAVNSYLSELDEESRQILKQVIGDLVSRGIKTARERAARNFANGAEKAAEKVERRLRRSTV